ncbi:MAG: CsbD family protein [Acidimicrobiales bacterium]
MGTRDKLSNQAQNLKGKVEETVGTAIGDDHMRAEGKMDQYTAARMGRPQVVELGVVESVT